MAQLAAAARYIFDLGKTIHKTHEQIKGVSAVIEIDSDSESESDYDEDDYIPRIVDR